MHSLIVGLLLRTQTADMTGMGQAALQEAERAIAKLKNAGVDTVESTQGSGQTAAPSAAASSDLTLSVASPHSYSPNFDDLDPLNLDESKHTLKV